MGLDVYDDIERCMEGGWSDGLPVIPPYASLVDRMLQAMGWQATDLVGQIKEQDIDIRAEHLAATAVMAGCKFDYGPVLRAVSEALVDPNFYLSPVEVTTGGASATVIVSGPIVEQLGFEHEVNALGANNRANATIGRFAQMVRYFCGRGGGVIHSHGTMGHPGRLSFCIAEHPQTVWGPFHTQFGHPASASVVSLMSTEGPNSVNNHYCESGDVVLDTISDCLAHLGTTSYYWHNAGYLVAIGPEHMDLIAEQFTRDGARGYLFEKARRATDELIRVGRIPRNPNTLLVDPDGTKSADMRVIEPGTMRSPMRSQDQLHFIETGNSGGKFSAVIPRWVGGLMWVCRVVHDI